MKAFIFVFFLFSASRLLAQEASKEAFAKSFQEAFPELDLEELKEEQLTEKTAEEKKQEENWVWMADLLMEMQAGDREISALEASRIEEIYEHGNRAPKIYALMMLPLFQDVSRWSREIEVHLQSDDREFAGAALSTIESRLKIGSEREKLVLSNNEKLLSLTGSLPGKFPEDQYMEKRSRSVQTLAEPFKGKAIPESKERQPASARQPAAAPQASENRISPAVIAVSLLLAGGVGVLLWPKLRKGK